MIAALSKETSFSGRHRIWPQSPARPELVGSPTGICDPPYLPQATDWRLGEVYEIIVPFRERQPPMIPFESWFPIADCNIGSAWRT